ncbi:MAG: hypothetical protein MI974_33680 [Chitinophagales bacterium]|nr:hypothetical protein [Chitinophagales bacterium]
MRELLKQILGIGMIVLLASCGKDVDIFEPAVLESGNIDLFFQEAETAPVQFTWDATEEMTIKLPSKGQIIIPANAFIHENGEAVSGMVQTNIIEITNKAKLLGNRQSTTAEGMLVNAISTLRLDVLQNGQPLQLGNGVTIRVQVVDEEHGSNLKLFVGDDSEGFINWQEAQNDEFPIRPMEIFDEETNTFLRGVEYTASSLGWLQCGSYLKDETEMGIANVCVELPLGFSTKNTVAYLVFRNYNTAVSLDDFNTEITPTACGDHFLSGYWADLIVIAQEGDDGGYFFAREFLAISENLTINIVPERASLSDIMLALEGL